MHLEILVEEPSAEVVLMDLVPRILGSDHSFKLHPYNGKLDLLKHLPARLRGYRNWLPKDWGIVVLVDADSEDCQELKTTLETIARDAGYATKSKPARNGSFQVLNRLAIEELEAWFFGDVAAIHSAYPKLPATLADRRSYRDPDSILGGTWERLEQELQKAGYYPARMPKIETARNVSRHMDPQRNRSRSFQVFRDGLLALVT
jgi:hypothetical protein